MVVAKESASSIGKTLGLEVAVEGAELVVRLFLRVELDAWKDSGSCATSTAEFGRCRRYRDLIMEATLEPRSRVSKGEMEVDKARKLSPACLISRMHVGRRC